jgi:hypothetical protein
LAKIVPDLGAGNAYFTAFVISSVSYAERKSRFGLNQYAILRTHVEANSTSVLGDRSQGFTQVGDVGDACPRY